MQTTDWSKVLVRSSCAWKVMTEGKGTVLTDRQAQELDRLQSLPKRTEKQELLVAEFIAKRDAPPSLSDTCTSYLREVYQFARYYKESVGGAQRSVYVKKGNAMEREAIMLVGRFFGAQFDKNDIRQNDTHKTGECDIHWKEKKTTLDTKSAWDMESLLKHVPNPQKPNECLYEEAYKIQGQCYMSLYNCDQHVVCYVLVNMPQEMIEWEKMRIFKAMNPSTEEAPDYVKAVQKMEFSMQFDEIPIPERIVPFVFDRDDEFIRKLHARWDDCRIWLEKFEKIHLNLHN